MPRPKGSKNKKSAAAANVDYVSMIAEKQAARADAAEQIESKKGQINTLKEEVKTLNAQVKSLDKEITQLEAAQAAQAAAEAEAAKKAEVEDLLSKLMADGMSAQEILEKLK